METTSYKAYINSNIEWMPTIPDHWFVASAKMCFDIQLGKMLQNKPQSYDDREVPYLKALHVNWNEISLNNLPMMFASEADIDKYEVKNGDLLVCEGGEVGRAAILKELHEPAIIQNALHRVRSSGLGNVKYFCYLLRNIADAGWFEILCNKATIAHLTGEKIEAIKIPIPSIDEQKQIAKFLDYKTAQIDRLIEKKKQLIEKLNEKRIAVITQAVTKGLDPTVPRKDSGVDWLGEVPEHWEACRFKDCCCIRYGLSEPPKYREDGLYFIRATDVFRGDINIENIKKISPEDVPWGRNPELETGEIIVVRSGAYTGDSAIISENLCGAIAGFDMVVTVQKGEPRFIAFILLSKYMLNYQIELARTRAAQPHLNSEQLGTFFIWTPPVHEQAQIVKILKKKLKEIERQKSKILEVIEKMQEYRTALITAAVTGKIDVRDIPIPDQEAVNYGH